MATISTEKKYSMALKAFLKESKGGVLRKYCEYASVKGASTYDFARVEGSTSADGTVDLFASNGDNAGDVKTYEATLEPISSGQKVKKEDLNKTELDVKSKWIKSMGNAVLLREDLKIISAIKAKDVELKKLDLSASGLATKTNVAKLIGRINGAKALINGTISDVSGVAVAMTVDAWQTLSESDYVLNADYDKAFGGEGKGTYFFGAEVLISDAVGDDDIFIIPSGTCGLAENPDGREGDATYYASNGMSYHLISSETIGAVCIDPANITRVAIG